MARAKKSETGKPSIEHFLERALDLGVKSAKIISADSIVTATWVRLRCQYGCPGYGQRLSCPPYSPTPEMTQKVLNEFKTAILVEGVFHHDGGSNSAPTSVTSQVVELEREIFVAGYYKAFSMGGGPCMLCDQCALTEGCRFAYKSRPSMEASGIDVFQTLKNNGIKLNVCKHYESRHRHFGVVLVE